MKQKILIIILLSFCFVPAVHASKESSVKKGNALYRKGDFESSITDYKNALKAAPESPEINFNLGTALYKNKNYADAVPYLQKGLLSNDHEVKKKAHFNLGDALFAAGLGVEKQDVDQAVKSLEESVRQFNTVMNLDDKDKDARYNQGIVEKELERLKKKQEQQKQQKQGNDQKQDQGQQDQQKQQKSDQDKNSSQNGSDSQKDHGQQQASSSDDKGDNKKPSLKPEDRSSQDAGDKDKDSQQSRSQSSQKEPVSGEMTKEEAKDLLKQFEQNEQPTGLLNFGKKSSEDRPVLKDW